MLSKTRGLWRSIICSITAVLKTILQFSLLFQALKTPELRTKRQALSRSKCMKIIAKLTSCLLKKTKYSLSWGVPTNLKLGIYTQILELTETLRLTISTWSLSPMLRRVIRLKLLFQRTYSPKVISNARENQLCWKRPLSALMIQSPEKLQLI